MRPELPKIIGCGDRDVGIGLGVTLIGQLPTQQVGTGTWPHGSLFLS